VLDRRIQQQRPSHSDAVERQSFRPGKSCCPGGLPGGVGCARTRCVAIGPQATRNNTAHVIGAQIAVP
jgi:hypothetical protein